MQIFNLVLYNPDNAGHYKQMYLILKEFYSHYDYVKTVFYHYSNAVEKITMNDDIMLIPGNECYVPGILNKTIEAIEYLYQTEDMTKYDYFLRTNISTVVDFKLLREELINTPVNYGGGILINLKWLDHNNGIVDNTWFGTIYAGGTSIIFSKQYLKLLIEKFTVNFLNLYSSTFLINRIFAD
jgi:hypothetical protein